MPNRASSLISKDQGFTRQFPITRWFSSIEERVEIETRFEQHQQERQWLASGVVRQCRREGQEIAEFEEQLQK